MDEVLFLTERIFVPMKRMLLHIITYLNADHV